MQSVSPMTQYKAMWPQRRLLAKIVGRNEMPFGRDTPVVPSSTVLDWGRGSPTGRRDLGSEPQSKFALQIVAKPLWTRNDYYKNSATPYPTVPPQTPYEFPSPNNMFTAMQPSAKWLVGPCYYYYYYYYYSSLLIIIFICFTDQLRSGGVWQKSWS